MAMHEWRSFNGKQYLFIDHGGTEDETLQNIAKVIDLVMKSGKKDLLILADTEKSYGTSKVLEAVNNLGKTLKPYTKRWAVTGVTGVKKILLKTFNTLTGGIAIPFDSEKQALEYLFKD